MPTDGIDRQRWDAAHRQAGGATLSRIKRETLCAALPDSVEPTTLWPAWPLDDIAAALQLVPGQTLADIGCGRGEVGLWIAARLDVHWIGVDPSAVGREMAGARLGGGRDGRRRRVVEGHFGDCGLPDRSADAVLVLDALHFAADLPAAAEELYRIVRPDGRLVVVGPNLADPRPALTAAGFGIEEDRETPDFAEVMLAFLARVRDEEAALRSELGDDAVAFLLSLSPAQVRRTRHGLIAARRPVASGHACGPPAARA